MRMIAVAVVGGLLAAATHIAPANAVMRAPVRADAAPGVSTEAAYTQREWRHRWWSNHHWNYR